MIVGGTVTSTVAWLLTGFIREIKVAPRIWIMAVLTAVVLASEWGVLRLPIPQRRRQISRSVLVDSGPFLGPFRFGIDMGTGVTTFLPSALPHLTLAAMMLLAADVRIALLAGAAFGSGRAMMPLLRYVSPTKLDWDRQLAGQELWIKRGCAGAAGLAIATMLLAAA